MASEGRHRLLTVLDARFLDDWESQELSGAGGAKSERAHLHRKARVILVEQIESADTIMLTTRRG